MDKFDFVEYSASRYGIDSSTAETLLNMFSDCLSDLMKAGQSVEIDGVGEFKSTPLFPEGLNHKNNTALSNIAKKNMVTFKASSKLTS